MGLMAWSAPQAKIELPGGGNFSVRGFALCDITILWSEFGEELFGVFDGLRELGGDDDLTRDVLVEASLMAWLGKVVVDFPDIVCTLIAVACVEEDASKEELSAQVAALPFPTQIEALLGIYRLTVEEAGGSKKFVDHLSTLVTVVTSMMTKGSSSIGTGDLEKLQAS